jgi:hypothetical protein
MTGPWRTACCPGPACSLTSSPRSIRATATTSPLAGGSTFGIPLDDPLEENPRYTIGARNIGDLVDAAHQSWKGYLQSADGPCDDTVHSSYWDDDLPFLYFRDSRDRPRYCAAHVVPLTSLRADLETTAATPNFAWIGPKRLRRHGGLRNQGRRRVPAAQPHAIFRNGARGASHFTSARPRSW